MKRLRKLQGPEAGTERGGAAQPLSLPGRIKKTVLSLAMTMASLFLSTADVLAVDKKPAAGGSTLFSKIGETLNEFYGEFVAISTISTVLVIVACLIIRQYADDDDAKRWMKRVKRAIASWVVIMILGSIIAYGESLFSGMQYTWK